MTILFSTIYKKIHHTDTTQDILQQSDEKYKLQQAKQIKTKQVKS